MNFLAMGSMSSGRGMIADESVVTMDGELGLNSICLNILQFSSSLDLVAAFLFTKNTKTSSRKSIFLWLRSFQYRDSMFSTVWLFIVNTKVPCIVSEGIWKIFVKWKICFDLEM